MSAEGPSKKPASYAFAQQTDSSCHIMPFINLSILQQLRETTLSRNEELDLKKEAKWYDKRQWLPQTFLWTKEWQQAIQRASSNTSFSEYQKAMLENGILNGHVYDKDGTAYSQTWNPIENYARMQLVPYNFTDVNTLPQELGMIHVDSAFKSLPLFWDKGAAIAYDPEMQDYSDLKEVSLQEDIDKGDWNVALLIIPNSSMVNQEVSSHIVSSDQSTNQPPPKIPIWQQSFGEYREAMNEMLNEISKYLNRASYSHEGSIQFNDINDSFFSTSKNYYRFYRLTQAQKEFFSLPEHATLFRTSNSRLGYEVGYKYRYLPEESEKHSYYQSSLLQLMLFCMGIDNQNKIIDKDHPLYLAHIALKTEMERTPHNPWALPSFKKENLLEYQIAKMIQADPILKKQMIESANIFFPTWQYYQDLKQHYDSDNKNIRKPLKDKMEWLLGEDQYLAYLYVMNARFLWAAATSREAFNAILELDPILARILQLPFTPGPNYIIRNAGKKSSNGNSFLDIWKKIRDQLYINPSIPKELASFSGHGIVISLYNDLYEQQMKNGAQYPEILNSLGFALIDSYYGNQLSPMYRQSNGKTSEETCDLEKLTAPFSASRRYRP